MSELVGRAIERRKLAEALADPQIALIRIAGPSGSGKTALAMEAFAKARQQGALAGWGKYSDGEMRSAFGPFMTALGEVVAQALDQLYEPQSGLASLAKALGESLGSLMQAGLKVDGLTAPVADAAGGRREGAVRVTAAALLLANWLDGFGCPIVLLIDDAFRAPPEAKALRTALGSRAKSVPWTIISTVRRAGDKPVPGAYTLDLSPMPHRDRVALMERKLGDGDAARSAFDWFGEEKLSTPGSVIEASRAILDSGAIVSQDGRTQIDPARLFRGAGNVLESVGARISALSAEARRLSLAMALWGDIAPRTGLASSLEVAEEALREPANELIDAGILAARDDNLCFTHDQLRAGILAAAEGTEQQRICAAMAEALRQTGNYMTTALHFRLKAGVENGPGDVWRDHFVRGATHAREQANAATATAFAEAAWRLRGSFGPVLNASEQILLIEAIYAAADRADTAQIEERAEILIAGSHATAQIADAYALAIFALWMAGASENCWSFVRRGLGHFGVRIPHSAGRIAFARAVFGWKCARLLPVTGVAGDTATAEACLRIAHAAAYPAYRRSAKDATFVALKTNAHVRRRAQSSAYWLAIDTLLNALLGRLDDAAQLSESATMQARQSGFGHAASIYWSTYFGQIWRTPQAGLRARCLEIWRLAIAEGDLPMAQGALRNWLVIGWRTCASLADFERDLAEAESVLLWFDESEFASQVNAFRGLLRFLTEPGAAAHRERLPLTPSQPIHILEMCSFVQDWAGAVAAAVKLRSQKRGYMAHSAGPIWCFHESVARLKIGKRVKRRDLHYLKKAARLNPADFATKLAIVEAEMLSQAGKPEALSAYKSVVDAARKGSRPLDAGIAAELARDAAMAFGNRELAETYAACAAAIWREWGARAKEEIAARLPITALESSHAEARAAEMSDRAKSRLLADVAHELRTPMQGLQSLLDIAQDRPESLDVGAMRDVLGGLKRIADDLTDYGTLSAGEAPLALGGIDLRQVLETEAHLLAGFECAVEVEIEQNVPPSLLTDRIRVAQVVRNLLSNAAKYGGGHIWLRASAEELSESSEFRITIGIEDDGCGLGESELQRIFEPFERGAREGDGSGTGLGLTIARRIAERLGGTLTAENREEGGARFTFSFEAAAGSVPAAPHMPLLRKPLSILLADDVALNRRAMAVLLRGDGHDVVEAADGLEAIDALKQKQFDVVLADISMPRATGIDVVRNVSALNGPRPQCLIITASSDSSVHLEALAAGAARILRKPLAMPELREVLGRLTGNVQLVSGAARNVETEKELATLADAARAEIRLRALELVQAVRHGAPDPAMAHRLAGLAAQFLWPDLAAAADALSMQLKSRSVSASDIARLAEQLEMAIPQDNPRVNVAE